MLLGFSPKDTEFEAESPAGVKVAQKDESPKKDGRPAWEISISRSSGVVWF